MKKSVRARTVLEPIDAGKVWTDVLGRRSFKVGSGGRSEVGLAAPVPGHHCGMSSIERAWSSKATNTRSTRRDHAPSVNSRSSALRLPSCRGVFRWERVSGSWMESSP